MLIKSFFAGFGGQGVLSMGRFLAHAAMLEGKEVTYLPAYGAEVRGGTAHCTVAISDEEISSPVASEPDYVVAMNEPSVLKFQHFLSSGGTMFINTTLVSSRPVRGDIEFVEVPATEIAERLNNPYGVNLVMLGVFIQKTALVSLATVERVLEKGFEKKKRLLHINQLALREGFNYLEKGVKR